ncbi:predicted protein [Botrytis cinerea T4]|uniref:Uncharacterized protein n=1 Tax=Botryotinia fuckeliana (strain T4) TaxID=999810 RepID=G2Y1H3_BOTF4|nr:predicted protein [Botrytis cinerea T4]
MDAESNRSDATVDCSISSPGTHLLIKKQAPSISDANLENTLYACNLHLQCTLTLYLHHAIMDTL